MNAKLHQSAMNTRAPFDTEVGSKIHTELFKHVADVDCTLGVEVGRRGWYLAEYVWDVAQNLDFRTPQNWVLRDEVTLTTTGVAHRLVNYHGAKKWDSSVTFEDAGLRNCTSGEIVEVDGEMWLSLFIGWAKVVRKGQYFVVTEMPEVS
jgi:hypothetical protein